MMAAAKKAAMDGHRIATGAVAQAGDAFSCVGCAKRSGELVLQGKVSPAGRTRGSISTRKCRVGQVGQLGIDAWGTDLS